MSLFSKFAYSQISVTASFNAPDTVCINSPVQVSNTSTGASNYYWSFCAADFNTTPQANNIGNPGNLLSTPVFMDYALDNNGNYYGFVVNYVTGHLVRLDYGGSLLNNPTAKDFGTFAGKIPPNAEGVQVKQQNSTCYVFVVSGGNSLGSASALVRIDFGTSFSNNAPSATKLGNVGALSFPHDLFIFQEGANYTGFTININDNTITRFDFGTDLSNVPVGTNLGTFGNMSYPCGFSFVNSNGNWYAFVTNRNSNSITRLDFGKSLFNTPIGKNIGNTGNFLDKPRDISIFQSCNGIVGLVVNEENEQTGSIIKLDFGSDLLSNPKAVSLGNLGDLKFPHSISKFFLEQNDIYAFITNVTNNSITRLRYKGCQNSSITSSTQKNPPPVSYDQAGVYNINLLVDIGLPTEISFCKQITVLPLPTVSLTTDTAICTGDSIMLKAAGLGITTYTWLPPTGLSNPNIYNPIARPVTTTKYFVTVSDSHGCASTDSVVISVVSRPTVSTLNDTGICNGTSVVLKTSATGANTFKWTPATGLDNATIQNPQASPSLSTIYTVAAGNGICTVKDSVRIAVLAAPNVVASNDTTVCGKGSAQLNALGANQYSWTPAQGLSNPAISNPLASPTITTKYYVTGISNNGCKNIDSVIVTVQPDPLFDINPKSTAVCSGDSIVLTASGGDIYEWSPHESISNTTSATTIVFPSTKTTYKVIIANTTCKARDTLTSSVDINPPPEVTISKSNDIDCNNPEAQLHAAGGMSYKWSPSSYIDNSQIPDPIVHPPSDTWYVVSVAGTNGCTSRDSIQVKSSLATSSGNFYVPNAFTPNGDGVNDCFGVRYWGAADDFEMSIYNRWGQLIYHSRNVKDCWDGTIKGIKQASGTYVYKIIVSSVCSQGVVNRNGTVVLLQ